MLKKTLTTFALLVAFTSLIALEASAAQPYMKPKWRSMAYNWHANYNHTAYGRPVALVVPPTAQLQTNWSWGAPSTSISRIDHQFGRNYPGPGPFGGGPYLNTPAWPSNMHQFGAYYVRGPWYPTQP